MFEQVDGVPLSPTTTDPQRFDGALNNTPIKTPTTFSTGENAPMRPQHLAHPQLLPLFEDTFKNMTLVGTIKIYKDGNSNLHVASG
ncbi:hypothetical protein CRE_16325 [Caenorhabditis remanei]|uniref:Uncharacterized protein n=2 Tax=Caenorhabditis TaxID=6237 RepID=E3N810_CAERE|nr:hypothetical protein CRE_16325 [Caenorhabditis remanei]